MVATVADQVGVAEPFPCGAAQQPDHLVDGATVCVHCVGPRTRRRSGPGAQDSCGGRLSRSARPV